MDRKQLFFTLLGDELNKHGFSYKKSINGFFKKENGNEFLYIIEEAPFFLQIEPDFRILLKSVENFKRIAWGKLYDKFASVGSTKRSLLSKQRVEECHSNTDTKEAVLSAVKKEVEFYESFVNNDFIQYSDIGFLDGLLNSNPDRFNVTTYNPIHTAFLAIIVAKLNFNPNFDNLIPIYREVVNSFNKNYNEEFELLVKHAQSGSVLH
ncbi:MAG: hypothetical protein J0M30_08180 [Chitinophagales bacterium]|nr:hypothetical protein [Chitinophagales bacterium]